VRAEAQDAKPGLTLLDGKTFDGRLEKITPDGFQIGGRERPIPIYEVSEIRFGSSAATAAAAKDFDANEHPLVRLSAEESLSGRVLEVTKGDAGKLVAKIRPALATLPEVLLPLDSITAFRLREAHANDEAFREAAEAKAPTEDLLFVRRSGLLRVAGTFRGLSSEHLFVERAGKRQRVKRQMIHGVVRAPVASTTSESDLPSVLEIPGAGRIPAYLVSIEGKGEAETLTIRFPGAPKTQLTKIPTSAVTRVLLASDRVLFLSTSQPAAVDQRPVVGKALRYRNDKSVAGTPISLGGQKYRRGLGVHSYCALDYNLAGQYKSFAAVIGLDDSSKGRGSVTFRVVADDKELYEKDFQGKAAPEAISLPMTNVQVLRLIVDYGSDQLDTGDHADWADARVSK